VRPRVDANYSHRLLKFEPAIAKSMPSRGGREKKRSNEHVLLVVLRSAWLLVNRREGKQRARAMWQRDDRRDHSRTQRRFRCPRCGSPFVGVIALNTSAITIITCRPALFGCSLNSRIKDILNCAAASRCRCGRGEILILRQILPVDNLSLPSTFVAQPCLSRFPAN
jgi:transcription elongation factor Elf1